MSSLFQDGCCSGSNTSGKSKTKCNGCVCDILMNLANNRTGNICNIAQPQQLLLLAKGTNKPINAEENGSNVPTVFTFQNFDPENCCAFFTFMQGNQTLTFIVDCRALAGIVCVPTTPGGGAGAAV